MTNAEFYKNEILGMVRNNQTIGLQNNKLVTCKGLSCEDCGFSTFKTRCNHECENVKIKWLYSEYKPQKPKLTKQEHAFCEAVGSGWLARNRNQVLYLHEEKPVKDSYYGWTLDSTFMCLSSFLLPSFDFIEREDEEPYSVKEMLEWEVENE